MWVRALSSICEYLSCGLCFDFSSPACAGTQRAGLPHICWILGALTAGQTSNMVTHFTSLSLWVYPQLPHTPDDKRPHHWPAELPTHLAILTNPSGILILMYLWLSALHQGTKWVVSSYFIPIISPQCLIPHNVSECWSILCVWDGRPSTAGQWKMDR